MSNTDTIQSWALKTGISEKKIIDIGLDPNDKIGISKKNIIQAYRKQNNMKPPTKDEKEILIRLGFNLDKKENITQLFIDKVKLLNKIGISTSNLGKKSTIKELANKYGIDIRNVISLGLNPNENIYNSKKSIIQIYRGQKEWEKPTKEQVEELKELGIILEKNISRNNLTNIVFEEKSRISENNNESIIILESTIKQIEEYSQEK